MGFVLSFDVLVLLHSRSNGNELNNSECRPIFLPKLCIRHLHSTGPGYLGCYANYSGNFHSGVLRDSYVATDLMTVSACKEHCEATNSHLASLKNGQECYCGKLSQVLPPRNKMSDGQCQVPCPGNTDEVCGGGASLLRSTGPDRLTVFDCECFAKYKILRANEKRQSQNVSSVCREY